LLLNIFSYLLLPSLWVALSSTRASLTLSLAMTAV